MLDGVLFVIVGEIPFHHLYDTFLLRLIQTSQNSI